MSRLALLLLVCFGAVAGEPEAWKAPANPKDDQHWYPELPDNSPPHPAILNGSFEEEAPPRKGHVKRPIGWAHPDQLTSMWVLDSKEHGSVIELDTDVPEPEAKKRQAAVREAQKAETDPPPAPVKSKLTDAQQYDAIGATYGVSFYSEKFACKPEQPYKISFDFKGPGGGAKVWVRGWGPLGEEKDRRRWETIVNCRTAGGGWRHFEQAFHPTRRPTGKEKATFIEISYLRVMLYAYWPRGQYRFDNIKIEEISNEEYARMRAIPAEAK